MTLKERITEYFEANGIKSGSPSYNKLLNDITDGDGIPREALVGRFVFEFNNKSYFMMNPKLQNAYKKK